MKPAERRANFASRTLAVGVTVTAMILAVGLYGQSHPASRLGTSATGCGSAFPGGAASRVGGRHPPNPQPVRMRVEPGWHALGSSRAPVTMVEFTDLECPLCRRFQGSIFAEIKKDYIDTGKLRFIARDMPLPMHPYALPAAEAARCAGDQGKFWRFRDAVLSDQVPPTMDILLKHAGDLGVNLQEFRACLNENKYRRQIQADKDDAAALGIHGTPAFAIGRVKKGWLDGLAMTGARPFAFFQQEIDGL